MAAERQAARAIEALGRAHQAAVDAARETSCAPEEHDRLMAALDALREATNDWTRACEQRGHATAHLHLQHRLALVLARAEAEQRWRGRRDDRDCGRYRRAREDDEALADELYELQCELAPTDLGERLLDERDRDAMHRRVAELEPRVGQLLDELLAAQDPEAPDQPATPREEATT